MLRWHIVTGEYPPTIGGVSDYSGLVAEALAAEGDEVHVWCPHVSNRTASNGVTVHPSLGQISSRDLRAVDRQLDGFPSPRRLLVQWVPQGFGYHSMNVGFCLWLGRRARRGDRVEIMVHEPYLAFGEGALRWTAAASVHRAMTVLLTRAASRIWIAIPAWERHWRPYTLWRQVPFAWLPIPSTLPAPAPGHVQYVRKRVSRFGGAIVGHLGSHGADANRMLSTSLPEVLEHAPTAVAVLLGQRSDESQRLLAAAHPQLASRLHTTGALPARELAGFVAACDVLVQPYPDGVSSRRTSAMAGLALGAPMVTTRGRLTEPLWTETACASLVPVNDSSALVSETLRLIADDRARRTLAERGRATYAQHFDLRHTIDALRRQDTNPCASRS